MFRSSLALALLAGLVAVAQEPKPLRVAFVANNPHEFWHMVEAGCKAQALKSDVVLDFKRPQNGTSADQREIIDALVAKGVKALSVSVIDPKNQTYHLVGVAAKIPLLAVDNDAPDSKRKCYIGTDNVKAGRAAGKLIKEAKPNGAKLALFVGQIEADNARERIKGVLDELGFEDGALKSKDGKYRLHRAEPFVDGARIDRAKEMASTALLQMADEPDVCLVGVWAYNPPAILAALKERALVGKVAVVGFDEDLETLKGIDDGHIYGAVVQNPYEFGRKSVEVMAGLVRGEKVDLPAGGFLAIPERIVTRTGGAGRLKASEYRAEVKKLLGK